MNEHVALWPKLTLARELPFSLCGTLVRPSALEVETGGAVVALEPRVMKVLVALHRAKGHPVSRDELIDICWDGRIVTEGALNRCVMQLRKALQANPEVKLDTIATVGYRLQAGAEAAVAPANDVDGEPPAAPPVADARAAKPDRKRWIVGGGIAAALAVVAGVGTLMLTPRPVTWTIEAYHQLTAEPGMETHPALSPNGQQLVFAQRPDSTVYRDLYIRSVDQGTPIRITTDPNDDHSAAWSPSGDRIAFVRTTPGGHCSILVVPMPVGPERTAARCQESVYTRVSWMDADTLVFGDRPSPEVPWRLRTVDLTSGVTKDLTAPSPETLGDSDPMVSPNGKSVVFRRTLLHGADDLFLKDLKTGRERALTTDGWKAAGYVWSHDSRHIFYSSNRGGDFGLWTVDTARRDPPKRISLGAGQFTFSRMSSDRYDRLAVEAPRTRTNVVAMGPDGAMTQITNTGSLDWEPEGAADGTVAYVSNRSGGSEIWITKPDGQSVRLTHIMGSYVHSPQWSPDGQTIAFVAVKGRKAEIYTVGRDGSRLRPVTADGLDKMDPVWAPAGDRLHYLLRTAEGYRLMQIPLSGGGKATEVAGGRGLGELRIGPDGRLFGLTVRDSRVVALDGKPIPDVRLGDYDSWTVGPLGIYVFAVRKVDPPALWLHPWNGPARKLRDVGGGGDIGIAADGRALFSQHFDEQVDLGLFDLKSR